MMMASDDEIVDDMPSTKESPSSRVRIILSKRTILIACIVLVAIFLDLETISLSHYRPPKHHHDTVAKQKQNDEFHARGISEMQQSQLQYQLQAIQERMNETNSTVTDFFNTSLSLPENITIPEQELSNVTAIQEFNDTSSEERNQSLSMLQGEEIVIDTGNETSQESEEPILNNNETMIRDDGNQTKPISLQVEQIVLVDDVSNQTTDELELDDDRETNQTNTVLDQEEDGDDDEDVIGETESEQSLASNKTHRTKNKLRRSNTTKMMAIFSNGLNQSLRRRKYQNGTLELIKNETLSNAAAMNAAKLRNHSAARRHWTATTTTTTAITNHNETLRTNNTGAIQDAMIRVDNETMALAAAAAINATLSFIDAEAKEIARIARLKEQQQNATANTTSTDEASTDTTPIDATSTDATPTDSTS